MTGRVYYNDFEPFCVEWLKNLIAAGHLPAGDVDNRSIQEVTRNDVAGYTQCHFFAGIGGWPYALKLAGWPADRPVWTGSCPCQPFSAAGRGKGADDARHIWPDFFRLISECRPPILFGEQVASKDGRAWLGAVRADLETVGYAVGAADLCAAGVGAPHIRQRLWFVADTERNTRGPGRLAIESGEGDGAPSTGPSTESGRRCHLSLVANTELHGCDARITGDERGQKGSGCASGTVDDRRGASRELADSGSPRVRDQGCGSDGEAPGGSEGAGSERERFRTVAGDGRELGNASDPRLEGHSGDGDDRSESGRVGAQSRGSVAETGGVGSWSACEWLPCRDGKARPVEPGTFPLAHGIPGRVGRLRAYGNAIVPEAAETFIRSVMECRP